MAEFMAQTRLSVAHSTHMDIKTTVQPLATIWTFPAIKKCEKSHKLRHSKAFLSHPNCLYSGMLTTHNMRS